MTEIERKSNVWTYIATCHPVGRIPFAPGTWGTLAGMVPAVMLKYIWDASLAMGMLALAISVILGWWSIAETERLWQTHDDKSIVIDEVVGIMVVFLFAPLSVSNALLGFGLFRLFDIWKPGPIGWADRDLSGALGTFFDDVLAGLAAGICLWLISGFIV